MKGRVAVAALMTIPSRAPQWTVDRRMPGNTSAVWPLKRSDGSVARLAVRNTNPTTFEWVTVGGAAGPVNR